MGKKDYLILVVLVLVAVFSVLMVTSVVEANQGMQAAHETEVILAYPGPYPMYGEKGPKLLPLIYSTGN
jgi:hypothetical protein